VGTKPNTRDTQTIDCKTCGQEYTPVCAFRQGRCPHHPAMIDMSAIKNGFTNLINFLKGK
jgi:S-adenosylmethionine/arginine decarboxylase-like enzyme